MVCVTIKRKGNLRLPICPQFSRCKGTTIYLMQFRTDFYWDNWQGTLSWEFSCPCPAYSCLDLVSLLSKCKAKQRMFSQLQDNCNISNCKILVSPWLSSQPHREISLPLDLGEGEGWCLSIQCLKQPHQSPSPLTTPNNKVGLS